jgi:hypothetical protein
MDYLNSLYILLTLPEDSFPVKPKHVAVNDVNIFVVDGT